MDCCPYCGSRGGLYSKEIARYAQFYTFNGEEDGFSDLDTVVKRKTTPLYCVCCDKRVAVLEKLQKSEAV